MVLCPNIIYSCCSTFDELEFHKNWFYFYQPKIQVIKERSIDIYSQLAKQFQFFKTLEVKDLHVPIKNGDVLGRLLEKIKKINLDPALRPLLNLLPKVMQ